MKHPMSINVDHLTSILLRVDLCIDRADELISESDYHAAKRELSRALFHFEEGSKTNGDLDEQDRYYKVFDKISERLAKINEYIDTHE